jgi:hypothetical protein
MGRPLPALPVGPEDALVRATRVGPAESRERAARALERLRFAAAAAQPSVAAWLRFLSQHPSGIFAPEARALLAEQRFRRARDAGSPEALQRFLMLHPEAPAAAEAWKQLASALADRAIRSGRRERLVETLRRFPEGPRHREVAEALERLDLAALGDDPTEAAVESFLRVHPRSTRAGALQLALATRLAERIGRFGDLADLAPFLRRFPGHPASTTLRESLRQRSVTALVLALDAGGLAALEPEGEPPNEAADRRLVVSWIRRQPALATTLRGLIRQALPYVPEARIGTLVLSARVPDPRVSHYALKALARLPALRAVDAMAQELQSPEPLRALAASQALRIWAARHSGPAARRLLLDRAAEAAVRSGPLPLLTEAVLRLAAGDGTGAARVIGQRTWHWPWDLVANAVRLAALPGSAAAELRLAGRAALQAGEGELRKLAQIAPVTVTADRRLRAEALAFELHRLSVACRALAELPGAPGTDWSAGLREVASRAAARSEELERLLISGFPDYATIGPDSVEAAEQRHAAGQARARQALIPLLGSPGVPTALRRTICTAVGELGTAAVCGRPDSPRPPVTVR